MGQTKSRIWKKRMTKVENNKKKPQTKPNARNLFSPHIFHLGLGRCLQFPFDSIQLEQNSFCRRRNYGRKNIFVHFNFSISFFLLANNGGICHLSEKKDKKVSIIYTHNQILLQFSWNHVDMGFKNKYESAK